MTGSEDLSLKLYILATIWSLMNLKVLLGFKRSVWRRRQWIKAMTLKEIFNDCEALIDINMVDNYFISIVFYLVLFYSRNLVTFSVYFLLPYLIWIITHLCLFIIFNDMKLN